MSCNVLSPKYLKKFKCIGGSCSDSCCIGWDVDIDKHTFRKYYKVKDNKMKEIFQRNLYNNNQCFNENIDYGNVKLKEGKRCPFLDNENYCVIQSNLGEEYLSNVCSLFPRVINKVDNIYEISLDVSCPEVSRIVLGDIKGIDFEKGKLTLEKHIISREVNTTIKESNNSKVKYIKEIRNKGIEIIKNKDIDLNIKLFILGDFLEKLEDELKYNFKGCKVFIQNYNIDKAKEQFEEDENNCIIQVCFLKEVLDSLNVFEEVDSINFKDYTKDLINIFKLDNLEDINNQSIPYIKAYKEHNNIFKKYSYILENYLVNFMFNNLFPFSETDSVFDGYVMLIIRYSLIKLYLVSMYLKNREESKEQIINFIQVFSKIIEHHKTFLVDTLREVKGKELNNIEFMKTLI